MAQHNGETFSDSIQVLDGNVYDKCNFNRCRVIYGGGPLPVLNGCNFNDCSWQLAEGAERTMIFLRMLYHGLGPGGRQLVEETLKNLRQPITPGAQ